MAAVLTAVPVALVVPVTASATPPVPEQAPATPHVAATEEAAVAAATRSGHRVEVLSERTVYSQTFAEPTGRLTYEAAVVPQRTRLSDGTWADIDLTLRAGGDGTLRPVASVADVRFSAGGKGPLVAMVDGADEFTMTWPGGPLPAPVVAGDAATYPEVLPGVDLVVRATHTGFSHVLVVKTAQAAVNPAVRAVRLELGGDAEVTRMPDGGLRATVGRRLVAAADPPTMWDSKLAGGAFSTHARVGDTARTARVGTEVTTDGNLVLRPDTALLSTATFPLYIDPGWSKYRSKWAYATSNNSNNNDMSVARVGDDPESGIRYRSFFQFPTTEIRYKHIESAYVQMKLDHSWSCDDTWTNMYYSAAWSGGSSAGSRAPWSTRLISWVASALSHANEGDGCKDSPQPDMPVNFINNAVTSTVQNAANNGFSSLTFGFCACDSDGSDEGATDRWKKWWPGNAKLVADVDAKPGKPTSLQVTGIACTTAGIPVGTVQPNLSATFPDADGSQQIRGTWEWLEVPASGTWNDATPRKPAPAQTTTGANTRATTSPLPTLTSLKKYAFRVKGKDPAPYDQESTWSDWCVFWPDTTAPVVTVMALTPEAERGPGKPVTFRIDSPASDVVRFQYGWSEAALLDATPTTAGTGKTATVTVTVPRFGTNILYAKATDATMNFGVGSRELNVPAPVGPVARWGLETYPGETQVQALEDKAGAVGDNTPLTATAVSWTSDARLIGGQTATFNGGAGQAVASGLVPDTTKSFSVAAWARMPDTNGYKTFVSKDGGAGGWSTFRLALVNGTWCFTMNTSQTTGDHTFLCTAAGTAVANRWTHVAGGYDKAEGKMRLWVDGRVYEKTFTTPITTPGPIVVGRAMNAGSPADRTYGSVADVQFFDRVLVEHDFIGLRAEDPVAGEVDWPGMLDPILTGQWDFDATKRCYEQPTVFNNCLAPAADNFGRRVLFNMGTDTDGGWRGNAVLLDGVHWAAEGDPYYGLATYEYGVTQQENISTGEWTPSPVLRTDDSFTVSVWVRPDRVTGGNMSAASQQGTTQSAFHLGTRNQTVNGVTSMYWSIMAMPTDSNVPGTNIQATMYSRALTEDDTTTWTHLVGVYDAKRGELRLYVNGERAASVAKSFAWQASGPFMVGAARWSPDNGTTRISDGWNGGIDDVFAYQGAMTDAQVHQLYTEQASEPLE